MKRIGFSIEIFPPKATDGLEKVYPALEGLSTFSPDFISVTCSAGGSIKGLTAEVSALIQDTYGIPSVSHLTAAGMQREDVHDTLDRLREKGIERILALRGDLTEERKLLAYRYATDLIADINAYGEFGLYAACYPEGHSESQSFYDDIKVMKLKSELGVGEFLSQLFFDNADFFRLCEAAQCAGVKGKLHAGIMAITNTSQILRTVKLSGAKIPERLAKNIARYENKPDSFYQAGIDYAAESILGLIEGGVTDIHFYAMNSVKVTGDVYARIKSALNRT